MTATDPAATRLLLDQAQRIRAGARANAVEVRGLAQQLRSGGEIAAARRLLEAAWPSAEVQGDAALRRQFGHEFAALTAADEDLPHEGRLVQALAIVYECDDLSASRDLRSLELAGSLHTARWQLDGQTSHLDRALEYLLRGHTSDPGGALGICGRLAARVIEQVADAEATVAAPSPHLRAQVADHHASAERIRREVLAALGTRSLASAWHMAAARLELRIALGNFDAAELEIESLQVALTSGALDEAALGELAKLLLELVLARLRRLTEPAAGAYRDAAWRTITALCGAARASALLEFPGTRLGLALSGGGFRAALFHLGVLAKLAEYDLLRQVEFISCVSGGSILGTHYYLLLRRLLETKPDADLTAVDFIALVERLQQDFLAGVQTDLRASVNADLGNNLRALVRPSYSWTHRLGELYEERLFDRVDDGRASAPRRLDDLLIRPCGEHDFVPRRHNWRRRAKVPELLLNATTLNTGNCFRFTASHMGEAPKFTDPVADREHRLPQLRYSEAPSQLRLGHAVAASSCVPGFFPPISLEGIYPNRSVRLVDGGVYDNQGIETLLELPCTSLFVSDAGAPMEPDERPGEGMLDVVLRSIDVLQERIRAEVYAKVQARERTGRLTQVFGVHLKMGLGPTGDAEIRRGRSIEAGEPALSASGINRQVQLALARIRTDLDAFNDTEAYALMCCGYLLAGEELRRHLPAQPTRPHAWRFLALRSEVTAAGKASRRLLRILDAARFRTYKSLRLLLPAGFPLGTAVKGLAAAGIIYWAWVTRWSWRRLSNWFDMATVVAGVLLVAAAVAATAHAASRRRSGFLDQVLGGIMAFAGALVSQLQLRVFDKLYLRLGRVRANSSDAPGAR
jgi:predicted acylesterase/phospholipase RssA